jgi:hypothetical protein
VYVGKKTGEKKVKLRKKEKREEQWTMKLKEQTKDYSTANHYLA